MQRTASFGYWVRRRRKALDLTQEELARQVGCAEVTIRKIEADERRPSRQIAERLAESLQLAPAERAAFVQAARGELATDRLDLPPPPLEEAAALPGGTLTFLFTDIEGSTRLWERHPQAMPQALARHDAILREATEAHGGAVFRTVGDAFCTAFASAPAALRTALAAQRALQIEPWGATGPIRVRMALHSGTVELRDGEYQGLPLSRIARLLAAGHGGQVLLSRATQELVCDQLPPEVELRDLGTHGLKDLTRAEHIFQLVAADLPAEFPPLRSLEPRQTNLPAQLTPLVGRQREVEQLSGLLCRADVRLLTLSGPGGIGKTRLALAAAAQQLEAFADGVSFVALAPLSSPQFIVPAIAEALGFTFSGPSEPKAQLLSYLREKHVLLLLDNLEHLLDGVGLLTELLQAAPALKVLATSRERLGLQGEWVVELQGLAFPPGGPPDHVESYSAVVLFVERAQRARTDFALTERNRAEVARICQLVEGLPLAIELAAAWVRVLSCAAIAQEIERTLDFLVASLRDVPARHRSIRAVFEHSWQLLSAEEQRVLRQLSIFRGGFRRQAAEQVAGAALPQLASLVDKSLVSLTPAGRYQMHELLRQFCADKLGAAPAEQAATRERHSGYFLRFLHQREAALRGNQQKAVLEEIEAEVENVRAAWNWALEQRQVEAMDQALDSLYQFHWLRSHFQEGQAAFGRVAEQLQTPELGSSAPAETPIGKVSMKALARQGAFCTQLGQYGSAQELLQNSLDLARRWQAQSEIAFCLNFLGEIAYQQADFLAAEQLYRESLSVSQALGDQLGMADTLIRLGKLTFEIGDYLTAQTYLQESLDLLRAVENPAVLAGLLGELGYVAFLLGKYSESEHYYRESLARFEEIGDRRGMAGLALVAWGVGGARLSEAQQLMEESLMICREIGQQPGVTIGLEFLGHISISMGRYEQAQSYLQEALDLANQLGKKNEVSWILAGLGEAALGLGNLQAARNYLLEALATTRPLIALIAMIGWAMLLKQEAEELAAGVAAGHQALAKQEQQQQALEILSLVLNHPATPHIHKEQAARLLAQLEATLSPEAAAAARERGRARTWDALVEEILAANAG